jgi:hypothetical protein
MKNNCDFNYAINQALRDHMVRRIVWSKEDTMEGDEWIPKCIFFSKEFPWVLLQQEGSGDVHPYALTQIDIRAKDWELV